jgi:NAD(P)H dehydrogenase (quinone)
MASIGIVYFSMYGSTLALAREIAGGVEDDGGATTLLKAPHRLPDAVADSDGVRAAIEAQAEIAEVDPATLDDYDGLVFGSPTRFGAATSQLQNIFDQAGPLWAQGRLVGKPAGFFTGASTIHGGHEATILSMATFAFHQGMPIVPMGYSHDAVGATRTGGGPYGPTHLSPQSGKDGLSDEEIAIARAYGARFHTVAAKLATDTS